MGKIRAKTLGDQEAEQKEREDTEKRRLAKIEAEKAAGQTNKRKAESVKREEKEEAVEAPEVKEAASNTVQEPENKETTSDVVADKKPKKKMQKKGKTRERSAKYKEARALIEKNKIYPLSQALGLLEKTHLASFDETVELHINTHTQGVSGNVTLPHGTGKKTKVAVLNPTKDPKGMEELLKEIETGKISFDILVATPDAMPRLAKVARVLGPKGLMPNPKNGTISPKPEEIAEKFEGGQMNFKTEAKAPVIHTSVGKLSFGEEKLSENIKAFLTAVKYSNIRSVTLKSTMSPAIKLAVK